MSQNKNGARIWLKLTIRSYMQDQNLLPRILVVEDAPDIQLILKNALSEYNTEFAAGITQAKTLLTAEHYDLYILDISLPDGESFELCRAIRESAESANKPILFVSGRSQEIDKLKAFNVGADDFISKPFSTLELRARVQVKLRNWKFQGTAPRRFGGLIIDVDRHKVFIENEVAKTEVKLTNIEFGILLVLTERPEFLRSRQILLERVWGSDVSVSDRTIDVHVSHLRKKLGPFRESIEAVHGLGYTFNPGVAKKVS